MPSKPAGKERPDEEIARELIRAMKDDMEVPDDRITVHVSHGVVTLEGAVTREGQRDAAERCASAVPGVRELVNRIFVEAPTAGL